jgi:hypothetical protein
MVKVRVIVNELLSVILLHSYCQAVCAEYENSAINPILPVLKGLHREICLFESKASRAHLLSLYAVRMRHIWRYK